MNQSTQIEVRKKLKPLTKILKGSNRKWIRSNVINKIKGLRKRHLKNNLGKVWKIKRESSKETKLKRSCKVSSTMIRKEKDRIKSLKNF